MSAVVIFLQRGEYESMHQGLAVAAAAVAMGRSVELYFSWWALERLALDKLSEADLPGRADVADRLEANGAPTLSELYRHVRESKRCAAFACSGSLAALGLRPEQVETKVDQVMGWVGILQRTAGVTDRFFW